MRIVCWNKRVYMTGGFYKSWYFLDALFFFVVVERLVCRSPNSFGGIPSTLYTFIDFLSVRPPKQASKQNVFQTRCVERQKKKNNFRKLEYAIRRALRRLNLSNNCNRIQRPRAKQTLISVTLESYCIYIAEKTKQARERFDEEPPPLLQRKKGTKVMQVTQSLLQGVYIYRACIACVREFPLVCRCYTCIYIYIQVVSLSLSWKSETRNRRSNYALYGVRLQHNLVTRAFRV